jgi:hypothetical protein
MKKIAVIILFALIFSGLSVFPAGAFEGDPAAEPSGAYLRYTVDVNKSETQDNPGLAYHYVTIKRGMDYIIQEGDILQYDVYSYIDERGWGAIDGEVSGGAILRNMGLSDTEGIAVHTGADLSGSIFERWHRRQVTLGVTEAENGENYTVGRTLRTIQIAMHPDVSENEYQGVVLYDNIVITNNGEIKLVIFRDEGDLDPADFRFSHAQGATPRADAVEILVFSDEEIQAFRDEEERKIREEEERQAAREAAAAEAAAERERQAAEAAAAAQDEAEAEAQAGEAAVNDDPPADADGGSEGRRVSLAAIIVIAAGAFVALGIVIALGVSASRKKKKG